MALLLVAPAHVHYCRPALTLCPGRRRNWFCDIVSMQREENDWEARRPRSMLRLHKGWSMSTTAFDKSALDARVDRLFEEMDGFHINIPRNEEVRRYLAGHTEGLPVLVPIVARARQEFPVPAPLSLELYHDPETGEQDLKLYVRQASYEQGFWRRLLKICEPFEETFAAMSAGWLHVTTDYRSPTV